jgi:multidrug efflux system outer membrane protein
VIRSILNAVTLSTLLLPTVVLAQAAGDSAPVVTLAEARRRASAIDPGEVAARSRADAAVWDRRASVSALVTPDLLATTTYTHFSDPFFNFGTGSISPNAAAATLQASYSLLGFSKISEIKRAGAALESAEADEVVAHYETALATDAAYFGVLADRQLARVAADRLKRAQEQFGIARVRVIAGEAIATDSLQLLLEVNRARVAVLRSDSALAVSRLRLGRQIGLPGPAEAAPVDSAPPPPLPMTEQDAINELRTHGPELQSLRAFEVSTEAALATARNSYLPTLSIGATAGRYDAELFPDALKRSQLAIGLTLPIWDQGQRELQIARAKADRNVASAERADLERASAELMTQSYHGYQTARATIDLAQVGLVAARENFRVQNTRYREGATTILDLLEAQVALTEAEAALIQARFGARLALARVEALLGRRVFGE